MFALLGGLAIAAAQVEPHGYLVFATRFEGRCGYSVQDIAGLDAKQLEDVLSKDRDPSAELQILFDPTTPYECLGEARRVATRLHYQPIFVRPALDKDRGLRGVP